MTITINGTTGITNDGGYTGDGVVFADTTPANTLVTTTGGNVGVGTATAPAKLTVGALGVFRVQTGSTTMDCTPTPGATDGFVWNTSASSYYDWAMSGSTKVRIDSSGNLLVGTTSSGGEIGRLTVKQGADADSGGLRLIAPNSSNAWAPRTGSDSNFYFGYNGTSKANINSSSGAYSAMSDLRLKENVQESIKGLADVLALRAVSYTFIDDETKTSQIGLIAQEVEPLLPEVVSTPTSSNQYYGLNYAGVVPVLVKAIQEQQAIIDAQQAALTALTARVEALDARLTSLEGTQP